MGHLTAEEALTENIKVMGKELGSQYSALWQEVAKLHTVWSEFVTLFGDKHSRVDLLNRAAPNFFHMVQDVLWEATMLHVARLTDPSNSFNRKRLSNLTIRNLPTFIEDPLFKAKINGLIDRAEEKAKFCRDWRNRQLAHKDLHLALQESSIPLLSATVKRTTEALEAIAAVLNAITSHYKNSETIFSSAAPRNGALALLYIIDDGLRAERARRERWKSGTILDEDLHRNI